MVRDCKGMYADVLCFFFRYEKNCLLVSERTKLLGPRNSTEEKLLSGCEETIS